MLALRRFVCCPYYHHYAVLVLVDGGFQRDEPQTKGLAETLATRVLRPNRDMRMRSILLRYNSGYDCGGDGILKIFTHSNVPPCHQSIIPLSAFVFV